MKKDQTGIIPITLMGVGLFIIHFLLQDVSQLSLNQIIATHIFIYLIFFQSLLSVHFIKKFWPEYVGFSFIGFGIFKMLLVVGFIWIMISQFGAPNNPFIIQIMPLYFLYLGVETLLIVKKINILN